MNVIKVARNLIVLTSLTFFETNLTLYFFAFHSYNPKQKQNPQIASSRAKARSPRSQTCVKYRGIIIFIKRNIIVSTGDRKICHKKGPKLVDLADVIFRVTHCQNSAMTFVFTRYSFCNSFRHGLILQLQAVQRSLFLSVQLDVNQLDQYWVAT